MRIVLMGPPGGGKGTQAGLLKQQWQVPHISTGELLRAAVREGTPLGLQAKATMDAGELVSDDLMLGLIEERLAEPDAQAGFILDGYPRNLSQAKSLDEVLERIKQPVSGALLVEVDPERIVERLAKRAAQEGRSDDNEATVRKRLAIYAEQTAPVANYYAEQGQLVRVLGEGEIEQVTRRILAAVEQAGWHQG